MIANPRCAVLLTSLVVMALSSAATGRQEATQGKTPFKQDSRYFRKQAERTFREGENGVVVGFNVIKMPAVKKELKLTDKQKKQILEAYAQQQARTEQSIRDEDQARAAGRRARPYITDTRPTEQAVIEILNPDQRLRFQQIRYQRDGVKAFRDKLIVKSLNLNDDQEAFIKSIFADFDSRERELLAAQEQKMIRLAGESNAVRFEISQMERGKAPDEKKLEQLKRRSDQYVDAMDQCYDDEIKALELNDRDALKAISNILTRKQRDSFKKLVGKPFDWKKASAPDPSPTPDPAPPAARDKP